MFREGEMRWSLSSPQGNGGQNDAALDLFLKGRPFTTIWWRGAARTRFGPLISVFPAAMSKWPQASRVSMIWLGSAPR